VEASGGNAVLWIFAAITAATGVGQMVAMIGAMILFFRARGAAEQTVQSRVAMLESEQARQIQEDEKLRSRLHDVATNIQSLLLLQTKMEGKVEGHETRIRDVETLARRIERQVIAHNAGHSDHHDDVTKTPR